MFVLVNLFSLFITLSEQVYLYMLSGLHYTQSHTSVCGLLKLIAIVRANQQLAQDNNLG